MENSSSSLESYDSYQRNRHNIIDEAVEHIKRTRGLEVLDVLGRGTYGDVLLVRDLVTEAKKDGKIISEEHTSETETRFWPNLLHQNVLPTEEPIEMKDETTIFISPVMFKGLDYLLSDEAVLTYTDCIQALKTWLKEALLGVQYVHEQGYCHMDLKLDNILVGYDGHACIADFTFLNKNNRLLTIYDLGLPRQYQPPEVFQAEFRKAINGTAVDMWSFGIAVIEAFTNQHLIKSVEYFNNWHEVMKPELKRILENPAFESLAKAAFPKYSFMEGELLDTLTISNVLLQEDIHMRPIASKVLDHPFFDEVKDYKVMMSDIFTGQDFGLSQSIFTDGEKNAAVSSQRNMNLAETSNVQAHDTKVELVNKVVVEEHIEDSAYKEKIYREGLNTTALFGHIQCANGPLLHSSVHKERAYFQKPLHRKNEKNIRKNFRPNLVVKNKKLKKKVLRKKFKNYNVRDVSEDVAVINYINRVMSNNVPCKKLQEEEHKSHEDLKFAENFRPLFVPRLCEDICDPDDYTSSKPNGDEFDGTFAWEEETHIEKLVIDNNNLQVVKFNETPLKFVSKYDESLKNKTSLKSSVARLCKEVCDPDVYKTSKTNGDEFDVTFACEENYHIEKLVIDNNNPRVVNFDETPLKFMMSKYNESITSKTSITSSKVSRICEDVCDPDVYKSSKINSDVFDRTFACEEKTHIEKLVMDNNNLRVDNFDETPLKSVMSTYDGSTMSKTSLKSTKRRKSLKSWFGKKFTKCTRFLFCCCRNQG